MRVLVCGGRTFFDRESLFKALDAIHGAQPISVVISGMAEGADKLGYLWAIARGVRVAKYPADWRAHGKAAGSKRNQLMLDDGKPDLVVAFSGGSGTADMVRRSRAAFVPVMEWRP